MAAPVVAVSSSWPGTVPACCISPFIAGALLVTPGMALAVPFEIAGLASPRVRGMDIYAGVG